MRKKLKVSKDVLLKRLGEMVANKQLYHERSTNCYYLLKHGKLDLKEAGYGFIMVEGETEDYYVPKGKTKGAYDQDDVSFFVTEDAFHKKCAEIVAVLKRNRTTMIGKYKEVTRKGKTKAYVVSTHPKFPVKAEVIGGKPAEVGMIVYGKLHYTASHVMIRSKKCSVIKMIRGLKSRKLRWNTVLLRNLTKMSSKKLPVFRMWF